MKMDQFFKKSGKVVTKNKSTVKVTYANNSDPDELTELEQIKRENFQKNQNSEQKLEKNPLKKQRIYEFTKEIQSDEEKLQQLLKTEKESLAEKRNYQLGEQVTIEEKQENQKLQNIYSKGYKMLQS